MVTQVGHIAYASMRLDERNTIRPTLTSLSLLDQKVFAKKTVGDFR